MPNPVMLFSWMKFFEIRLKKGIIRSYISHNGLVEIKSRIQLCIGDDKVVGEELLIGVSGRVL